MKTAINNMRLHLLFPSALRRELQKKANHEEYPELADIIIADDIPNHLPLLLNKILYLKSSFPRKIIIARLDGPVSAINKQGSHTDQTIANLINIFADGIIFSSHWAQQQNKKLWHTAVPYETVIHNAADPNIYYPSQKRDNSKKTNLISVSLSPNKNKKNRIYKFLDGHLDFNDYQMTLVSNTPIIFNNIKQVNPVPTEQLAKLLRQHDIFIAPTRNNPYSNILLQALSSGLPTVASAHADYPELVVGKLFTNQFDILPGIDSVAQNLSTYQAHLPNFSITETANKCIAFTQKIYQAVQQGTYQPKLVTPFTKISTVKLRTQYQLSRVYK